MPSRKHQMPYTAKSQPDSNGKLCRNCGRSMVIRRPNQVFCNQLCKNRYHSRGVRRISQLEKDQMQLISNLASAIHLIGDNQKRIEDLEHQMKYHLHQQTDGHLTVEGTYVHGLRI